MAKKLFFIVVLVLGLFIVVSCGGGGTIIIENDHSTNAWAVTIGNNSTRPNNTVTIYPGQTYQRSFTFNGTYYAFGNFVVSGWRTKSVYLSGGQTVILRTGDFW